MQFPTGPFGCILADPPWPFRTYGGDDIAPTQGAQPYDVMSMDAIKALPVSRAAARDCALLMWVVDSNLPDAMDLGAAWGFDFKTVAFVWAKTDGIGMGYWTRKQTEQCWLFTRGSPKRLDKGVPQIIECGRGIHSEKPWVTHAYAQKLVDGPYLEMFARSKQPGWASWGNQVGDAAPLLSAMQRPGTGKRMASGRQEGSE